MKLSLAVIALNEEDRLASCLDSVPFASEKVVVDSGSTDSTASVAEKCGARVLKRKFTTFSEQKQFALDNCTGDWVLVLDADEALSSELALEIQKLVKKNSQIAYRLHRRVRYMGRLLKYGPWKGESVLRLFPGGSSEYDSSSVHERLVPSVPVVLVRNGWIEHRTYRSLSEQFETTGRYASLWAEQKSAAGVRSSILKIALRAKWRFFSAYFLQLGFLEGYSGFMASVMAAVSVFIKWSILREKQCGR